MPQAKIVVSEVGMATSMATRPATEWEMVQLCRKIEKMLLRLGYVGEAKVTGDKS